MLNPQINHKLIYCLFGYVEQPLKSKDSTLLISVTNGRK